MFNEKRVIRVEEEKFRLPVDVPGSKTSVLKLSIVNYSPTLKPRIKLVFVGRESLLYLEFNKPNLF